MQKTRVLTPIFNSITPACLENCHKGLMIVHCMQATTKGDQGGVVAEVAATQGC